MPEEQIMAERRKRRAFSARRHVARTEIGDCRDARALRNDGRLADLQRGADGDALFVARLRQMMNRLPVRADERDVRKRDARFGGNVERGLREEFAEIGVQMADAFDAAAARRRTGQNPLARAVRIRIRRKFQHAHARGGVRVHPVQDVNHRRVNPVNRRAGH